MLQQIARFLVGVAADFFVVLLLGRFLMQWLRVPFRNVLGQFVIAATNWMVLPARRVIPALLGLDWASLVLAWLVQGLGLWALYAIAGVTFASSPDIAAGILALLSLLDLARTTIYLFVVVLIVQAVLSWFVPYSTAAPLLDALTRPFLRPIRRLVPPLANVDLSPLVLIVLLQVLLIPLATLRSLAAALF